MELHHERHLKLLSVGNVETGKYRFRNSKHSRRCALFSVITGHTEILRVETRRLEPLAAYEDLLGEPAEKESDQEGQTQEGQA